MKRPPGYCPKCGTFRRRLQRDHVVPRWKFKEGLVEGDPNDRLNLQFICANCHQDKTIDDRDEFEAWEKINRSERRASRLEARRQAVLGSKQTPDQVIRRHRSPHLQSPESRRKIGEAQRIAAANRRNTNKKDSDILMVD